MTRNLIITADDFGAAPEVNEAVALAHRDGVLTAASLMVGAPAAAKAVAMARATPSLAVGLHLVLTDGRPTLPATQVPHLVNRDGRFHDNMAAAGATMFFSPVARAELAAEIAAQFGAFAATGLILDHVNAHKHFHLHPTITGLILRIGARHGLKAARVPIEPGADASPIFNLCAGVVRRRFRAAGLTIPDQVYGLRWSGQMTAARLKGVIEKAPAGLTEIYLHPATKGGYDGSAPGYAYGDELAALIDPGVVRAARGPNLRLGGFRDFVNKDAMQ
jgi:hopanoid biosynthesis associated protein HpnK